MELSLEAMRRNMVRLTIGGPGRETVGATRFGGRPDLPPGFTWPTFVTAGLDDEEVKPRPLCFLAQFNCAELAQYDRDGLLPDHGLLSFFYEMDSQRWGYDPKDAGCAQVFWFEEPETLVQADMPAALQEDYQFPVLDIKSYAEDSYPQWEDFCLGQRLRPTLHKEYEAAWKELGLGEPEICSKLLGWPNVIQNNMPRECELVSRGYYLGGDWKAIPEWEKEQAEQVAAESWRLLFQLDIVSDGDFELMFGDCGCLYFYIRREDLLARRFDRVWLILQCF